MSHIPTRYRQRAALILIFSLLLLGVGCQRAADRRNATPVPDGGTVDEGSGPVEPSEPSEPMEPSEPDPPVSNPVRDSAATGFQIFRERGGRVDWSWTSDLIAYDQAGEDGFFDVYVARPDGSEERCLTCDPNLFPQANNGQPGWHPSGEYIVLQVEDPSLEQYPRLPGGLEKTLVAPGVGINNNLWVMTADGGQAWQLTRVPDKQGVLHPHFSPDGTKLLWGETVNAEPDRIGNWAMKLADFIADESGVRIENVQTLTPLDLQLYETHGFSPDGTEILFSGIPRGEYYYDMEIYKMNLVSGETIKLTDNDEWDEHAHFTPDGSQIVWSSGEGILQPKGLTRPTLEYWIMNADGSNKRQLTYFNRPRALEYIRGRVAPADFAWGPDGHTLAAYVDKGRGDAEQENPTVLVTLDPDRLKP